MIPGSSHGLGSFRKNPLFNNNQISFFMKPKFSIVTGFFHFTNSFAGRARNDRTGSREARNGFRHRASVRNPDQRQGQVSGQRSGRKDEGRRPVQARPASHLLPGHLVREQVWLGRRARRTDVAALPPQDDALRQRPHDALILRRHLRDRRRRRLRSPAPATPAWRPDGADLGQRDAGRGQRAGEQGRRRRRIRLRSDFDLFFISLGFLGLGFFRLSVTAAVRSSKFLFLVPNFCRLFYFLGLNLNLYRISSWYFLLDHSEWSVAFQSFLTEGNKQFAT